MCAICGINRIENPSRVRIGATAQAMRFLPYFNRRMPAKRAARVFGCHRVTAERAYRLIRKLKGSRW